MKCLLIYNPVSGGSKKFAKKLPYIENELKKKYDVVDITPTNYAGEGKELAREACGKYDLVIAAGGDGTFSDILKGIGENKNAPALAYIPCGSCGDIGKNHNIPANIKKAVNIILKDNRKQIDLCKINDSYFSYVACIGTYTAGVYNTNQKLKRKIGRAAYYIQAFKETFMVKPYEVTLTVGKKVYKEDNVILLLVLNSKTMSGFSYFNYKTKLDDGKVDVVMVKKGLFNTPINIWKLFLTGVEKHRDNPNVKIFSGSNVSVKVKEKVLWNVDGDKSDYQNIDVECLKRKITMIVGE